VGEEPVFEAGVFDAGGRLSRSVVRLADPVCVDPLADVVVCESNSDACRGTEFGFRKRFCRLFMRLLRAQALI
jgi:hypothetical protein